MIILLPCYSIESLSLERDSDETNQLLSGWTSLYHPAFIEKVGALPKWENASVAIKDTKSTAVVVPPCCDSLVPTDWFAAKEESKTIVVRNKENRDEIEQEILEKCGLTEHGFDSEYVKDFRALGTAFVLTEMMTRQLRYMSMLDESQLKEKVLESITEYRNGNTEKSQSALQSAFELISQSKEYFYPTSSYLIDLTLVSPTTIGQSLQNEIGSARSLNLFLPSSTLREITEAEPQTLEIIRKTVADDKTRIIGDDLDSAPLPFLPLLEIADRVVQGILDYTKLLGKRPMIYGRAIKGLTQVLPQILKLAGYTGAVHFAPLDGWHITKEPQSKVHWEGADGTKIDSLMKFPMDSDEHETFFSLPRKMGFSSNSDLASTFVLAHFPEKKSCWLNDMLRASRFSNVLGRFSNIEDYFESTRYVGISKKYGYEKYWTNFLLKSVRENRVCPVSDWVRWYKLYYAVSTFQSLQTLCTLITKNRSEDETTRQVFEEKLAPLLEKIENRLYGKIETENSETKIEIESVCREIEEILVSRFSYAVYGKPIEDVEKLSDREIEKIAGILVVNPLGFSRTVYVDVSELKDVPQTSEKIRLVRRFKRGNETRTEAVVEVPSLGYIWIGPQTDKPKPDDSNAVAQTNSKPIAKKRGIIDSIKRLVIPDKMKSEGEPDMVSKIEEIVERRGCKPSVQSLYLLRNDYFEVRIDAVMGELRSIKTLKHRGNRFAHNIAFRCPEEDRKDDPRNEHGPQYGYSIMCADSIEIESPGPITGILKIKGRLMKQNGTLAANFVQKFIIRRMSRILETEIEIDPKIEPGNKPWDSYFAARFAWADSLLDVHAGVHGGSFPTDHELLHAPEFVDLRNEKGSITVFAGGLPYHRKTDDCRLDTILIPKGEHGRKFRLGIGIDVPNPVLVGREFLLSDMQANGIVPAPKIPTAWLFSTNAKNVEIVRLEPLFDESEKNVIYGKPRGLRVILQETENKTVAFSLRAFLPIAKAYKTDLMCKKGDELKIEGDRIRVEMRGRELLPIEIELE